MRRGGEGGEGERERERERGREREAKRLERFVYVCVCVCVYPGVELRRCVCRGGVGCVQASGPPAVSQRPH